MTTYTAPVRDIQFVLHDVLNVSAQPVPGYEDLDRDFTQAVLEAARTRTESRGCHRRKDRPNADDAWRRNVVLRLDVSGWLIRINAEPLRRAA